jgi:hypothetical protein
MSFADYRLHHLVSNVAMHMITNIYFDENDSVSAERWSEDNKIGNEKNRKYQYGK